MSIKTIFYSALRLVLAKEDKSSTPGSVTLNATHGRVAFAAGTSTLTVFNSLVTPNSTVIPVLVAPDNLLISIHRAIPGNGQVTFIGSGVALSNNAKMDFVVVN